MPADRETGRARRRARQAGVATVEFSLVLLPMFAMLFLIMDVGWMMFAWAAAQEGAREGVRYAVTGSGQTETTLDSAIQSVVQQYSFGFAKSSDVSIDYYPATGYSASGMPAKLNGQPSATIAGNLVQVTVQVVILGSFGPIFRFWTPVALTASACDVLQ